MSYIQAEGLRKVYDPGGKAIEALREISFSVKEGEFVSVLGPRGCGKSTLLMMCGGLEDITSGGLTAASAPVGGPRRRRRTMVQDPTLLPWKAVLENIIFPARIARIPLEPVVRRARD